MKWLFFPALGSESSAPVISWAKQRVTFTAPLYPSFPTIGAGPIRFFREASPAGTVSEVLLGDSAWADTILRNLWTPGRVVGARRDMTYNPEGSYEREYDVPLFSLFSGWTLLSGEPAEFGLNYGEPLTCALSPTRSVALPVPGYIGGLFFTGWIAGQIDPEGPASIAPISETAAEVAYLDRGRGSTVPGRSICASTTSITLSNEAAHWDEVVANAAATFPSLDSGGTQGSVPVVGAVRFAHWLSDIAREPDPYIEVASYKIQAGSGTRVSWREVLRDADGAELETTLRSAVVGPSGNTPVYRLVGDPRGTRSIEDVAAEPA